jgi:hypothetical protein
MKTKLTLFVAVLATALFGVGCSSFQTTETKLKQGLVAYYPFEGNAKDESGNKLDGTIHNAKPTTGKNGDNKGALQFNKDAWVTIGKHDNVLPNIKLTWSVALFPLAP